MCETVRARLIGLINLSILNVSWLRDDKWTWAVNQSDGRWRSPSGFTASVCDHQKGWEFGRRFSLLIFLFLKLNMRDVRNSGSRLSALLVSFSNLLLSEHFVDETLLKHDSHFKFNMRLIRYWKPEGPINTPLYLHLSSGCKKTISNECFY